MFGRLSHFLTCLIFISGTSIALFSSAGSVDEAVKNCNSCHGDGGVSSHPDVPTIGGYSAYYLAETLALYQGKERPCPEITYPEGSKKGQKTTMCQESQGFSEDDFEAIAAYYEEKDFVPAKQETKADLAAKGEKLHQAKCEKCHEDGGSSPDDDAGMLAGQWMPYLKLQFDDYLSGKRAMPEKMEPKMKELSAEDVEALLNYYGSLQ
ncbi:c-type cytochrome [Teredinibacter sp. KSP-S5-2]|uniref:c-type cytochrome n=1 Tax=Teredinibacter sp. KSP-S5-2 TaxID=3034506 RepID=UPI0029344151|nr:c-type cytochrome [Teredinibacter sp. KSP-S5-2]WNO11003.1 c-type cytochrome [Teredinibacter sp. KSP-S5-2]